VKVFTFVKVTTLSNL